MPVFVGQTASRGRRIDQPARSFRPTAADGSKSGAESMSMGENPYNPPRAGIGPEKRSSGRTDLKDVARYQKYVLICILIYIILFATSLGVPQEMKSIVAVLILILIVVEAVFAFMLSMKVYSTAVGIVMGIGTLVPCAGLLALLMISNRATNLLREHGHKVGLMGANLSEF